MILQTHRTRDLECLRHELHDALGLVALAAGHLRHRQILRMNTANTATPRSSETERNPGGYSLMGIFFSDFEQIRTKKTSVSRRSRNHPKDGRPDRSAMEKSTPPCHQDQQLHLQAPDSSAFLCYRASCLTTSSWMSSGWMPHPSRGKCHEARTARAISRCAPMKHVTGETDFDSGVALKAVNGRIGLGQPSLS